MSGGYTIRTAEATDAAAIAALERAYIDCPWTEAQIADEISDGGCPFAVAETADGEIVGFLSGACAADECEISNIAVAEPYRRRGVATALFKKLFDILARRAVSSVYLLVRDGNAPAAALYKSLGFNEVGRRRDYYGSGKSAVIMLHKL